jgi:hypothetical protein
MNFTDGFILNKFFSKSFGIKGFKWSVSKVAAYLELVWLWDFNEELRRNI